MNPFVLCALALGASDPSHLAETAPVDDWSTLDREIERLSQTASAQESTGPKISGYMRIGALWADVNLSDDELGVILNNARLNFEGKIGEVGYKISVDGASGSANFYTNPTAGGTGGNVTLKDAYGTFPIYEKIVNLQFGRNKTPFLFTGTVSDEMQVLWDRTVQGFLWSGRDEGAQINATFENFRAWLQVMNGGDGITDDLMWNATVAFDLNPEKRLGKQEGGYGVDSPFNLLAAAAYLDEGTVGEGSAFNGQLQAVVGGFWIGAEVVDYGEDYTPGAITAGIAAPAAGQDLAETTGWDVTAAFMFTPEWEVAARYQDIDNSDQGMVYTAGINYYVAGFNNRWMLNYDYVTSDDNALDGVNRVLVGWTFKI